MLKITLKSQKIGLAWRCMSVILAHRRPRQEALMFKANLSSTVRPYKPQESHTAAKQTCNASEMFSFPDFIHLLAESKVIPFYTT